MILKEIILVSKTVEARDLVNILKEKGYTYPSGQRVNWCETIFIDGNEYVGFFIKTYGKSYKKESTTYTTCNNIDSFKNLINSDYIGRVDEAEMFMFENGSFKKIWEQTY